MVGQDHVTRTLRNALRQGHPAHAYLFCGPRGTGKTSTARILAAALNCEHPADGDACGDCDRCREVAADRLVDVQEIDAASHRGVEDVRALRETVGYAPAAGRHKVYILDEVHMLTEASWNTLLKTLEEPPAATSFVLCTTDARKVLATVVSRCQRFDFRRLGTAEIVGRLREVCLVEHIAIDDAALRAVARRAEGGLRDALSILDQLTSYAGEGPITAAAVADVIGAADDEAVERLLAAAESGDLPSLFREVEMLYSAGKDMAQVARDLLAGLRGRVEELIGDGSGRMRWQLQAIEALSTAEAQMRRWSQPRLALEIALLQLVPGAQVPALPAPDARPTPASAAARPPLPARPAPQPVAGTPDWAAVVAALRAQSAPAGALLREATFEGCADGVLRLRFAPGAHAALAEKWKPAVAEAWRRHGGGTVRVEYLAVREAPAAEAGAPPAAPARPPAGRGPAPAPDAAFRRALALFEGVPL